MNLKLRPELTALASYPRSGVTYTRMLIKKCLGMGSRCIGPDVNEPMTGDASDNKSWLLKTHDANDDGFERAIHIVRSPFDALESFYHYQYEISGIDLESLDLPWWRWVEVEAVRWNNHAKYWLQSKKVVARVAFEDLLADPHDQMFMLGTLLGLPVSHEQIENGINGLSFKKLHKSVSKRFFRRGISGYALRFYTPEQVNYVLKTCGKSMESCGLLSKIPQIVLDKPKTDR